MSNRATPTTSPYAAVFIDFENIYYFLKNHFHDPPDLNDYALDLIRNLRDQLKRDQGLDTLVLYAYADFDKIPTGPQGPLYLMGVSTRNVLGTDHKNAADMQLCIDALEVLYTRPDIGTFVLVAGDRDYIPVLQHLRRQARQVKVVGFRESVSGDLLQMLGRGEAAAESFIEARELLPPERLTALEKRRTDRQAQLEETRRLREHGTAGNVSAAALAARSGQPAAADAAETTTAANAASTPAAAANPAVAPVAATRAQAIFSSLVRPVSAAPRSFDEVPPAFAPVRPLTRDSERRALAFLLREMYDLETKQQRRIAELWLGPFMRRLTDELPELPDYERRDLINKLRDAGTLRIEKREGEPHPFSVIVVNYNHPDVQALNPGEE